VAEHVLALTDPARSTARRNGAEPSPRLPMTSRLHAADWARRDSTAYPGDADTSLPRDARRDRDPSSCSLTVSSVRAWHVVAESSGPRIRAPVLSSLCLLTSLGSRITSPLGLI